MSSRRVGWIGTGIMGSPMCAHVMAKGYHVTVHSRTKAKAQPLPDKAGVNLETMLQSISGGAAACWTLDNLAPRILARDFEPGFFVDHFIKDMGIALEEAKRVGLVLPGLALVHQLYLSLQAQSHGKKGTHALLLALEELSHRK